MILLHDVTGYTVQGTSPDGDYIAEGFSREEHGQQAYRKALDLARATGTTIRAHGQESTYDAKAREWVHAPDTQVLA